MVSKTALVVMLLPHREVIKAVNTSGPTLKPGGEAGDSLSGVLMVHLLMSLT